MKDLFIIFSFLFVIISCSTISDTRNSFSEKEFVYTGGIYHNYKWDDELKLKRYSWYKDATMTNEIVLANLDRHSPFSKWLGRDFKYLNECEKLQVLLLYSNSTSTQKNPYLEAEIEDDNYRVFKMLEFEKEFKAHHNFKDWGLEMHNVYGLCKLKNASENIVVTLPGFKSKILK